MSKVKSWLKRQIPTKAQLLQSRFIRPFAPILAKCPDYWLFNRSSVTRGCAVAGFGSFMPIPFQMIIALILALPLRANLIIALGLLWISNPLTVVPMYWLCYLVGTWILREPVYNINFHLSWHWITHELAYIWKPFLLGCLICGTTLAVILYVIVFFIWHYIEKYVKQRSDNKN